MQTPAHISQDSDSGHPTKVVSESRKYIIKTHFPKVRICENLLRLLENRITKSSCRRRTGETLLSAEKFGDLITADHKVFNEGGESRDNHTYAFVVQDLATQWIQSYPCKTKLSHETKKSLLKFLGAVASTESCLYRQLDGIWVSMWSFFMESPHFNTSSIRDKLHRWKSLPSSERRIFNNISTMRTRWKVVVRLYGMLLLSAKCPRPLDRWENAIRKAIWRTIQRPIIFFGAVVEYYLSSPKDKAIIHQICKKVSPGIFLGYKLIAGGIWKGEILIAYLEDLEKLDASDIYLRTSTMNFEFNSTCLWKKHSLFQWNVLIFARSIHIDLDVLQEKKIGDYWNVDRASICQILGEGLQSSLFWKRSFQKGYVWSGRDWQKFRRLPDQIFNMARRMDENWKSHSQSKKKQDWAKEKQTLDNARKLRGLYFIDPRWQRIFRNSQKTRRT